jgi:hypothetical protein
LSERRGEGGMTFLFINIKKKKDLKTLRSASGRMRNVRIEINLDIPLKVPMLC